MYLPLFLSSREKKRVRISVSGMRSSKIAPQTRKTALVSTNAINAEAYLNILATKRDLREYDSILFAVLHMLVLLS